MGGGMVRGDGGGGLLRWIGLFVFGYLSFV